MKLYEDKAIRKALEKHDKERFEKTKDVAFIVCSAVTMLVSVIALVRTF